MISLMNVLKRVLVITSSILISILLGACGNVTPVPTVTAPTYTPTSQYLSTPELIDQAFVRGEITEEERLLYLAYAFVNMNHYPPGFEAMLAGTLHLLFGSFMKP